GVEPAPDTYRLPGNQWHAHRPRREPTDGRVHTCRHVRLPRPFLRRGRRLARNDRRPLTPFITFSGHVRCSHQLPGRGPSRPGGNMGHATAKLGIATAIILAALSSVAF